MTFERSGRPLGNGASGVDQRWSGPTSTFTCSLWDTRLWMCWREWVCIRYHDCQPCVHESSKDALMQPRLRTLILAVLLSVAPVKAEDKASAKLTFVSDILPIFKTKCIRCHAGVEPKAGLNLTSPSSLRSEEHTSELQSQD